MYNNNKNNKNIDWIALNKIINSDLTDCEVRMCTSVNNHEDTPYVLCLMSNNIFGIVDLNNIYPGCHVIGKINISLKTIVKKSLENYMPENVFIFQNRDDNDLYASFIDSNANEINSHMEDSLIQCSREIILKTKNLSSAFNFIPIDICQLIETRKLQYVIN